MRNERVAPGTCAFLALTFLWPPFLFFSGFSLCKAMARTTAPANLQMAACMKETRRNPQPCMVAELALPLIGTIIPHYFEIAVLSRCSIPHPAWRRGWHLPSSDRAGIDQLQCPHSTALAKHAEMHSPGWKKNSKDFGLKNLWLVTCTDHVTGMQTSKCCYLFKKIMHATHESVHATHESVRSRTWIFKNKCSNACSMHAWKTMGGLIAPKKETSTQKQGEICDIFKKNIYYLFCSDSAWLTTRVGGTNLSQKRNIVSFSCQ